MNSTFNQELKKINFTTFYRNQKQTFGYDDLFADQRVIVFSVTQWRTLCSIQQINGYMDNYANFIQNNVDAVYVLDSTDWLIGPYIDKKAKDLIALPDRDMKFVETLAKHFNYSKATKDLARFWQYVLILNNGEPEKLWHNPFKEDSSLGFLKDPNYRYRKLSADTVLKYLIDTKQ